MTKPQVKEQLLRCDAENKTQEPVTMWQTRGKTDQAAQIWTLLPHKSTFLQYTSQISCPTLLMKAE